GVEVGVAGGADMEGATLDRGDAFGDELRPAFDQPRFLGAIGERLARDLVIVFFVRLTKVGGIGIWNGALRAHPVHGGARVEPAGKRDADLLPLGQPAQDVHRGAMISDPARAARMRSACASLLYCSRYFP